MSWLKNSNSQKYKQLEYVLSKMEKTFTVADFQNFLRYSWETHGQMDSRNRLRKIYGFHGYTITTWLKYRDDVIKSGKGSGHTIIYEKRNKNENVDDRPKIDV